MRSLGITAVSLHTAASPDLLAQALCAVDEASLITDRQRLAIFANAAFSAVTGYPIAQILGRNCRFLQGPQTAQNTVRQIREALDAGGTFRGDILNYRSDGRPFWNALTITPLRDAAHRVTHFVSVQRDVTEMHELRQQLTHLALHDALTGLPNRLGLSQHLELAIARADRSGNAVAVCVIDLDRFKPINDQFGHAAGDQLLQTFARRFKSRLRAADFLARLGGDEFIVVLEGLDPEQVFAQLEILTKHLHLVVETPFDIDGGRTVDVGMSMGVALFPAQAREPDRLVRIADRALYRAKSPGHRRLSWWHVRPPRRAPASPRVGPATPRRTPPLQTPR